MQQPLCAKVDTNFADKQRSLGWYSSLRARATEFSFLVTQKKATPPKLYALDMKKKKKHSMPWNVE
jgi:hypothetical protein